MLVPTVIWGWKTTLVRWMNVNSWDNEVPRWLLYSISPGYSRVQIGSFILLMMAIYHQTEDKWTPEVSKSEILDVRHSSSGEVLLFRIWCEKCFSDLWRSKLYEGHYSELPFTYSQLHTHTTQWFSKKWTNILLFRLCTEIFPHQGWSRHCTTVSSVMNVT